MAERAIREVDGKRLLSQWLPEAWEKVSVVPDLAPLAGIQGKKPFTVSVENANWALLEAANPWVTSSKLVVKPDQLIKRRGKSGLLLLNATWEEVQGWVAPRLGTDIEVEGVKGPLTHFIVEPFVPHSGTDEYYVCIQTNRYGEEVLFYHQGGIDVGDVDSKALRLQVPIATPLPAVEQISEQLLLSVAEERRILLASFIRALLNVYIDLNFVYLEINPLVITDGQIFPLDMAAKIDEAANFLCQKKWGELEFPAPFGRAPYPEEAYIKELDSKTGASLKLTILNRKGRVWTMIAGGGASVAYADTISDLGFGHELANYGEYSGAPSRDMTYEYAKTLIQLMSQDVIEHPKVLIIGGGIANFTDVAATFHGIIDALKEFREVLVKHRVSIWVRRGGPNCQEGLKLMRKLGPELRIPIHVSGPEAHITAVVQQALGIPLDDGMKMTSAVIDRMAQEGLTSPVHDRSTSPTHAPPEGSPPPVVSHSGVQLTETSASDDSAASSRQIHTQFSPQTRCVVYGMQTRAVQGMLDFDYLCGRKTASVAAMVFPFSGNHFQKFYWGDTEIMLPVLSSTEEAMKRNPDVDTFVNFASFRSVYSSTMEALVFPQIKTVAIIAEGVPEQHARMIIKEADARGVLVIGPATVGGITPGCFRIGNTGGMLDNVVSCKLYRPGSVAYVSKSGGMSNELNNILARVTDGVAEGVAIGGDRYSGSRFLDHILRYQANPSVKMIVLLGEVGGVDEYDVCRAMSDGRITKPVVAWCLGTCAKMFPYEVQFGHAGALAHSAAQTADAKNAALKAAGAIVPKNFNDFVACIRNEFNRLVDVGAIVLQPEPEPPRVPMDYQWAKSLGLIRKPAEFVTSITDERGEELLYAGMPISKVFEEDLGVGGVVSLLWFRRRLPAYACKFVEMILMVTADHGPAVSGAHNTIVTARAGKDLVSSLVSGLLTIGPRFGGALDEAALMFSKAYDAGQTPADFVSEMRRKNQLIMGIGHRVKSLTNPDKRVTIIKEYAKANFVGTPVLDYALEVEKLTTQKKANLILNVDGAIACAFVDMIRSCGVFTSDEADESIENGCLNGMFVLGRSIGLIGHFLDQKRLKQGLYRHPWDDISYIDIPKPTGEQ